MPDFFEKEQVILSGLWVNIFAQIIKDEEKYRSDNSIFISENHQKVFDYVVDHHDQYKKLKGEFDHVYEKEFIKAFWFLLKSRHRNARIFSVSFYAVGLSLLAFPTIDTFVRVASLSTTSYLHEFTASREEDNSVIQTSD